MEKFIDTQVEYQTFAKEVRQLWEDIKADIQKSGYTLEDVPKIIAEVRAA
ncbi:MAG: hypothetical protein ONB05_07715 [candidate division KSB1 bacterium]|nr:hypothetical protein [candidate division KSB1 bacterium]